MKKDDRKSLVTCPHCNGKTTCKCFSCGEIAYGGCYPKGQTVVGEGICKVCGGKGKIRMG